MAKLIENIGSYTATIEVLPPGQARLYWRNGNGKSLKSIPKELYEKNRNECKNIKVKFKNIKNTLVDQVRRVESFYLEGFQSSLSGWWKNYVDHPLMNSISSNLIWIFEDNDKIYSAILKNNKLITADGIYLDNLTSTTLVSLWHPAIADLEARNAWRQYIWENEAVQPFRQAFREFYMEPSGNNNPLSVHGLFVRQHQFRALLRSRGWRYQLRGRYDSDSMPELSLKENLICRIGIIGESKAISGAGIFLAVELGEIQFLYNGKPLQRSGLDPIKYSEVMRDIDLFASVSGLGYKQDWDQIEDAVSDIENSEVIEKLAKINGQASIICNDIISNNNSFIDPLINFLYSLESSLEKFPIPETVKIRATLLSLMLQSSEIADNINIEGRYINVKSAEVGYRVSLGSGLVFSAKDNQLIPIADYFGNSDKKGGGDTLLSRIYSLIFMLARDRIPMRKELPDFK